MCSLAILSLSVFEPMVDMCAHHHRLLILLICMMADLQDSVIAAHDGFF
jgi:hypothetical protein